MRSRSITIFNLDEEDPSLVRFFRFKPPEKSPQEPRPEPTPTEKPKFKLPTTKGSSRNVSAKAKLKKVPPFRAFYFQSNKQPLQDKKLAKLMKSHAEVWQENETSIVLKMLDDSVRTKDSSRMTALQRSLLEIERTPGRTFLEKSTSASPEDDLPMLPPSEFSLGPTEMILEEPELDPGSRNVQPSASTTGGSTAERFSQAEQEYLQKAIKQNVKQHDVQLNITIVGNGMTGKTSVTTALVGSKFDLNTPRSTGFDILSLYFFISLAQLKQT